jgi:hypothetical protein
LLWVTDRSDHGHGHGDSVMTQGFADGDNEAQLPSAETPRSRQRQL